ncbi:LysR substrate-binding domain-containing protein [Rhodoligotrophos appendicifer]|uniref:LysR substrate-binding domain-containing protein n=1 Tax=Rhodoligotrophos appendicifer TaxID=987056 RepID=UPI001186463B|nr:LysR substrate-binding domain-containing protein [Rhodoligotrophos appendicifer]
MDKQSFMQKLRTLLPPPNLLVTFEAAGRLLSFTRAASELKVTRVAVSQQIKALEDFLGTVLFNRLHRALSLTPAGERYHRSITSALEEAARATTELRHRAHSNIVNVTATTGFTTYWLFPNIGEFRKRHPEVELRFIVSDRYLDLLQENVDVAIRYGNPPFGSHQARFLVREMISPTCSPSLAGVLGPISATELQNFPLIHLEGPYDVQTRWSNWLQAQDLRWKPVRGGITVNTYTNLVQAALDGQGFALIGPPLIERFLSAGTLIQPVAAPTISRHAFHLITPAGQTSSLSAVKFLNWISEKFDI